MTAEEKLLEIDHRLSVSPISEELRRRIRNRLGVLTERDCDRLLYALRIEEGQLRRLDAALVTFLHELSEESGSIARAEEEVVATEVARALRDAAG